MHIKACLTARRVEAGYGGPRWVYPKSLQCSRCNELYAVTSSAPYPTYLCVKGSIPFSEFFGIAQLGRATAKCGFESHPSRERRRRNGIRRGMLILITTEEHSSLKKCALGMYPC